MKVAAWVPIGYDPELTEVPEGAQAAEVAT